MSRVNLAFILASVMMINACGITSPFVDRRREAGAPTIDRLYVGKSKTNAPAICYNALTTPYAEVKKLADEECIKHKSGSYAVPIKQTTFTCRLLIPNHFYFRCEGNISKKR